ncbi:oligoendopeptidase F [Methyloceanibacter superfactus]|uniref:Oligoendopeptidase F n=1 Tax=Methyloceanibacter superfactus TaxID=1774969 RepID=A0A1E3VT32_9HYPH|nr:M3 family oligoendopeptidase [Methyloceanibacter superfactus]ODR96682.1 oligoendopeptidase F [Methyloceanibacter superfactus]
MPSILATPFPRPVFAATHAAKTKAKHDDKPELGDLPEWNLGDLYDAPESPVLKADLDKATKAAEAMHERYAGKLVSLLDEGRGGAAMAQALREFEALNDVMGRIVSYASLLYAADTADPRRQKFYGDIQEKITAISSKLLFFPLELNRLDDAALESAMSGSELGHFRPWIEDLRKEKPYQLEDKLEQLFHEKAVTSRGAWDRLFNETMTSLRFKVDGEKLSLEPTLNLLLDPNEKKRKEAAEALAKVFKDNVRLFTLITNTLAKDKEISDRWRGFAEVADSRHLANRVEKEVVDALVAAVRDAYPRLSHRYYAMKAKWLGKNKLMYWDRNAPLPEEPKRVIGWDDAQATVLTAYGDFSPRMADIAGKFFAENWIDAAMREGKSQGAFSHPTVPSAHPYILLNYQGKPRDVMTLAHELGHGVHQVLANVQGPLMAPTPLTLAETASVFGEMLTFKKLLDQAPSKRERKALLAAKVEDMLNTVVRQIAFYSFERKVHEERREGELTSERLGEIWLDVQRESLGPAIELRPEYETFWCYIPHFIHAPFYVYAYAFGDCLVNSLYAVYEKADEGFAERYLAMLAAGGTKHHKELLAPFGLDATEPHFWSMGLKVIEGLIDELEAMDETS